MVEGSERTGVSDDAAAESTTWRFAPEAASVEAPLDRRDLLINLALYQAGWFACVLGAASGRGLPGAGLALLLVGVHVALVRDRTRELQLLAAAGALGMAVDSLQLTLGVFSYPSGSPLPWLAPAWIAVLWIQFATLLHFALRWLSGRFLLAAILGFLGGPLSFYGGERLGAIVFASPASYLVLACVWALAMPLLVWLGDRVRLRSPGYRRAR